jgi:hypothetical protein
MKKIVRNHSIVLDAFLEGRNLQLSGPPDYSGKGLFSFAQRYCLVQYNLIMCGAPVEELEKASSPLWEILQPSEQALWTTLANKVAHLGNFGYAVLSDQSLWEKLNIILAHRLRKKIPEVHDSTHDSVSTELMHFHAV